MTRRDITFYLFYLVGLGMACTSFAAETSGLHRQGRSPEGIIYLSGGIGADERGELQLAGKDYNIKLGFAEKSGHYLSDVEVVIQDADGNQVLDVVSEGPWFFAKLPPGKYTIAATNRGSTQQQVAHVSAGGQRVLYFYW